MIKQLSVVRSSFPRYAKHALFLSAVSLLFVFTSSPARAVEFLTAGAGGFFYDDPNNWFGGTVPGPTENITFRQFPAGNARQVLWGTGTGNTVSGDLEVLNSLYTFTATQGTNPEHRVNGSTTIRQNGELRLGKTNEDIDLITSTLTLQEGGKVVVRRESDLTTGSLTLGNFGAGATLRVESAGSDLIVDGTTLIGFNGSEGTLVLTDSGDAEFLGLLDLASGNLASKATVEVQTFPGQTTNTILRANDINVGANGAFGQEATLTVDGGFSLVEQLGASTLTVGAPANSTATLNIKNNGRLNTGTGGLTINNTGTVNLNAGGTLQLNGPTAINGGTLLEAAASTILYGNEAMLIKNGGLWERNAGIAWAFPGFVHTLESGGAYRHTSGGLTYRNGATLNVNGGLVDVPFLVSELGGIVNLSDGEIQTGSFTATTPGTFNHNGGELIVDGGALVVSDPDFHVQSSSSTGVPILTLRGSTSNSTLPHRLVVGSQAGATLNIEGGAMLHAPETIFLATGAGNGDANVTGMGSTLSAGGDLRIGQITTSTLTVGAGASATAGANILLGRAVGSNGTAIVDGNLQAGGNIEVGFEDVGLLEVRSNGEVTAGDSTNVGSSGTLRIDGGMLTTGSFRLDPGGTLQLVDGKIVVDGGTFGLQVPAQEFNPDSAAGDVEIVLENGAVATTGTVRIRRAAITVDGPGSRWDSSDTFGVGRQGNVGEDLAGELNILDGGVVQGTNALIANEAGARGNVVIDGKDSEWISTGSTFLIANVSGSVANLDITNGGALTSNTNVQVAIALGSTADIHIVGQDSLWDNSGDILLGIDGQATLAVEDNGLVNLSGELVVGSGGRLEGDGVISATGGVVVNGVVDPGTDTSTGALTINGGYTVDDANAVLDIGLAGDSASEFDQLLVSGTAALDGTLGVLALNGFAPSIGQAFKVVRADQITGQFAEIEDLEGLEGMVEYKAVYSATAVTLVVAPQLEGDFNADGVVDAADYTVWRDDLGSTTNLAADADLDLVVDIDDYLLWRTNYGASLPAAASQAGPVPEPASAMLAAIVLTASLIRCRRF